MSEVTRILTAAQAGDPQAADQLLPLVYDELRRLAAVRLASEKPGQTLEPTALVHEAYLRLVGNDGFASRGHFFAAAAEAMRRILVDNARRKQSEKHGGGRSRVDVDLALVAAELRPADLLALDEALSFLQEQDCQAAQIVELHCFAGLTIEEAAASLGISERTAYRDWSYARAWLFRRLSTAE
jgi:RNA polymerase sigma factor (TIGR02999 family)